MKLKDKLKKFRNNIIAGVLAGVVLVSPFLPGRLFRKTGKEVDNSRVTMSSSRNIEDNSNDRPKDFIAEVDKVKSTYNYDYSDLNIDLVYNADTCNEVIDYDYNDTRSIYDKTTIILNQIKNNSIAYLGSHPGYVLGFVDISDEVDQVDRIATQAVLRNCISDILKSANNKDICLFKDLKLFISYDNTRNENISYFKEDNLLVVYPDNIRKNASNKNTYFWDTLKYEMLVQLNKIRLDNCDCQNNDISFPYKTITEAAVVSELYNLGKHDILVDDYKFQSESLVLLLGLFNKEVSINDYYKVIFNNDVKTFYEFCCCDNEDIDGVNRILYEIDNKSTNSDIGCDYVVDIFKMVIKNMTGYTTNNKDFTLKDNLVLFNVIRTLIASNIDYNSLNGDEYSNIISLNDIYIEFLASHYDTSIDWVLNMMNSDSIYNCSLAVIDLCNRNVYYEELYFEYSSYGNKLIERFPLLRQILANRDIDIMEYYRFANKTKNNIVDKKYSLVRVKK